MLQNTANPPFIVFIGIHVPLKSANADKKQRCRHEGEQGRQSVNVYLHAESRADSKAQNALCERERQHGQGIAQKKIRRFHW